MLPFSQYQLTFVFIKKIISNTGQLFVKHMTHFALAAFCQLAREKNLFRLVLILEMTENI